MLYQEILEFQIKIREDLFDPKEYLYLIFLVQFHIYNLQISQNNGLQNQTT